jgi:hypothetical protein
MQRCLTSHARKLLHAQPRVSRTDRVLKGPTRVDTPAKADYTRAK